MTPEECKTLEILLDTALEHFSHGWRELELANMVTYADAEAFPPSVRNPVGSAAYHFAAVSRAVKMAYDMITSDRETP